MSDTIKVAELTGYELDYWVAKAMDFKIPAGDYHYMEYPLVLNGGMPFIPSWEGGDYGGPDLSPDAGGEAFQPSRCWNHGGPIIEREDIVIERIIGADEKTLHFLARKYPFAKKGATYLEAAMRAYVSSKFGETVPA